MNALRILLTATMILYLSMYHPRFWLYFFGMLIPYYSISYILFANTKNSSPKKKAFVSMWTEPYDPQIYGTLKLNITYLLEFLAERSKRTEKAIHLTTFITKVMGCLMAKHPNVNGNIIFGKYVNKNTADISCLIANDSGSVSDLVTVRNCNNLSLEEISKKLDDKKEKISKGTDTNYTRRLLFARILPTL